MQRPEILRTHLKAAANYRPTPFDLTSAGYIEAERILLDLPPNSELRPGRRHRNWVGKLHAYESLTELNGRTPRENTRNRAALPAPERRLAEWARYQRRLEDDLCNFQRIRLDVSPAFEWDPQQAAWDAHSFACIHRATTTGQLPHLNSTDLVEFTNARWLGRQLRQLRMGTLLPDRAARINEMLKRFTHDS
jgi:hypothetical protein